MNSLILSEKEEAFLVYWEANRARKKKWMVQLLVGLPVGLGLSLLIALNFFSGWHTRAAMEANSKFNPIVLLVALAVIAIFFALFSKKFQWDQYEQQYKELTYKKKKLAETGLKNGQDVESLD